MDNLIDVFVNFHRELYFKFVRKLIHEINKLLLIFAMIILYSLPQFVKQFNWNLIKSSYFIKLSHFSFELGLLGVVIAN